MKDNPNFNCLPFLSAVILAASVCVAFSSFGADGDLDTTFGMGGKVITDFGSGDQCFDMAVLPDGKILVGGYTRIGVNSPDFLLVRHHANGSLDTSFGTGGKTLTDFGGADDKIYGIAVQTDGKIVVAGHSNLDFALARYHADGSIDMDFGTDGKVITDIDGDPDVGESVAIQADGKIVVIGTSGTPAPPTKKDFAVVRYLSNGDLDLDFSTDGKLRTNFAGNNNDEAQDVVIQSDGKIVVVGYAVSSSLYTGIGIARYETDGDLDPTFSGDGMIITGAAGSIYRARGVAIDADGKIVVAGEAYTGSDHDFALARYTTTGSLDSSFSGDGKVLTDFDNSDDVGQDLVIQPDGKIVVAGITFLGTGDYVIARYDDDGDLDTSFDADDGKVTTDFGGGRDSSRAVALDSGGGILVAGFTDLNGDDFLLARYGEPLFRPDNHIGLSRTRQKGNNRYNVSGTGQKQRLTAKNNRKEKFFFTVQNDGTVPDTITVGATKKSNFFDVKYTRIGKGNVTGRITKNRLKLPNLAPGAKVLFKAEVTPDVKTGATKKRTFNITSKSQGNPRLRDRVKAIVNAKN